MVVENVLVVESICKLLI